jgi:hypothetical protein
MKPNLFSALFVSKLGTNEPFWVEVKMMKSTKSALLAASALALMLTAANAQEYGPGSYDDGYNAPPPPSEYGPGPYGNDDYGPPPPADYGEGYGAPENAPENMPENVIVIAPPYQTDHSSLAPTEISAARPVRTSCARVCAMPHTMSATGSRVASRTRSTTPRPVTSRRFMAG